MSAREDVLGRVRAALAATAHEGAVAEPVDLPPLPAVDPVELLHARLEELGALVIVTPPEEVAAAIAAACAALRVRTVAVPDDWPPDRTAAEVKVSRVGELSNAELADVDAAITASRMAIAETGSIVLDGGALQGPRRLTLLPGNHICLLAAAEIVHSFEAGMKMLATTPREGRPLTFVSGPSATTDIELTRIEGVHGPRRLAVVMESTTSTS